MNDERTIDALCASIDHHRNWALGQLGQDAEDMLADAKLAAVVAVRNGTSIMTLDAYAHGIVMHAYAAALRARCSERRRYGAMPANLRSTEPNPEARLLAKECQHPTLVSIIGGSRRAADRDILTRFYVENESKAVICEEMHLTDTQFRLNKSRAKTRLTKRLSTPDTLAA